MESAAQQGYRGVISFGIAGGLLNELRAGDSVVASAVLKSQTMRKTDAEWSSKLLKVIAGASYAPIVGVDAPIADPAMKRELHRSTGAAAVDIESHLVARLAAAHGLALPPCASSSIRFTGQFRPPLSVEWLQTGAQTYGRCCATSWRAHRSYHYWSVSRSMPSPLAPRCCASGTCSDHISAS